MRWLAVSSSALTGLLVAGIMAVAAPPGVINAYNALCDAGFPTRCVQISAGGAMTIAGSITANSGAVATAAPPTYVEGTSNPFSQTLGGALRVTGSISATSTATATANDPTYVEATGNPFSVDLNGYQRSKIKAVSGSFAAGAISDGADVVEGSKSDARSIATDATAISIMQVLKEISFMEQTPAITPASQSGAWNVGISSGSVGITGNVAVTQVTSPWVVSGAVTQSGTWNVGQTGSPWGVTGSGSAGAAASGVVTVQGIASMTPVVTSGIATASASAVGSTLFTLTLAATTNATSVKASAGSVYSISGFNMSSATPVWISLYNTAGTPSCGSSIIQQFMIPGSTTGAGFVYDFAVPKSFSTGIGFCATTGIAGTGAPAASTYVLNVDWK